MAKNGHMEIEISVRLNEVDDKDIGLHAYAFDSNAKLIISTAVNSKGIAKLNAPAPKTADQLRILIGPKIDDKEVEYSELVRRGAKLKRLRVDAESLRHSLDFDIYPADFLCWLRSACYVHGDLHKRVLIGGSYVNYPVCNAEIEVYEVDPLYIIIPRLPLDVLERFRDIIINPVLPDPVPDIEPPVPFPVPRPAPDPAVFRNMNISAEGAQRLNSDSQKAINLVSKSDELRFAAQSGNTQQFQRALIDHPIIVRPLLCWIYPRLVTMQKVATTTTDDCGKFTTLFFRGCNNPDQPDLYFKAKQRIFGFLDVTIYAPTPIACYTWWNYDCQSEVNLFSNHPWAQTCSPCPPVTGPDGNDLWVAFMSIGAVGLNNIRGTSVDLAATTDSNNLGLTEGGSPWGGTLLPRLEFSNALQAAGVHYYQLSWRRGTTGGFTPMTGTINHYYRHDVTNSDGITLPVWTPETLGPKEVDDGMGNKVPYLYSIPFPSLAPAGVWDVPPNISEIKQHFASGKFFTKEDVPGVNYSNDGVILGTDVSGIYQLKVDLFDQNGQAVDIGALGIVYAVPTDPDASDVIQSVNADSLGLVDGNSMIINLHISNNPCYAAIDAPVIGGSMADPCCGVLNYAATSDNVTMSWDALHPNNFATYTFNVVRGINNVVSDSNTVASSSSPIARTTDHMLNYNLPAGCDTGGCPVAGFSENLHVDALATDGWSRLQYLDANAVRAFVLAELETETP